MSLRKTASLGNPGVNASKLSGYISVKYTGNSLFNYANLVAGASRTNSRTLYKVTDTNEEITFLLKSFFIRWNTSDWGFDGGTDIGIYLASYTDNNDPHYEASYNAQELQQCTDSIDNTISGGGILTVDNVSDDGAFYYNRLYLFIPDTGGSRTDCEVDVSFEMLIKPQSLDNLELYGLPNYGGTWTLKEFK